MYLLPSIYHILFLLNRLTTGLCVDCAVPQLLDTLEEGGEDRGHGAELRLQPGRHRRNLVQQRERRLQSVSGVKVVFSVGTQHLCVWNADCRVYPWMETEFGS